MTADFTESESIVAGVRGRGVNWICLMFPRVRRYAGPDGASLKFRVAQLPMPFARCPTGPDQSGVTLHVQAHVRETLDIGLTLRLYVQLMRMWIRTCTLIHITFLSAIIILAIVKLIMPRKY